MTATVTKLFSRGDAEHKYILEGDKPMPISNVLDWGLWMEKNRKNTSLKTVINGVLVSTVFLGLDHGWGDSGKPILWETMTFVPTRKSRKRMDQLIQIRATNAEDAKRIHDAVVKTINSGYSASWIRKRLEEL